MKQIVCNSENQQFSRSYSYLIHLSQIAVVDISINSSNFVISSATKPSRSYTVTSNEITIATGNTHSTVRDQIVFVRTTSVCTIYAGIDFAQRCLPQLQH